MKTPLERAAVGLSMFGALCLRDFSHHGGFQLLGGVLAVLGFVYLGVSLILSRFEPSPIHGPKNFAFGLSR